MDIIMRNPKTMYIKPIFYDAMLYGFYTLSLISYIRKKFAIISIIKSLFNLFLDVINHGIFLGNSLMCDKRFYNTKDNKLCSIVARQYHWLIKKIYAVMILGILKWPCVSQHTIIRISVASFCVDRIFSTCIIYEYYDKCACKCQPKY